MFRRANTCGSARQNIRGRNFGMLATFLGIGPMYTVLERDA